MAMIPHLGVINSALSTVVPTDRTLPDHCAAAMDQSPSARGLLSTSRGRGPQVERRFRSHVGPACADHQYPQKTKGELKMKRQVTALAAGLFLLAGAGAAAAQDVVIAPEQETVIREYVKKKPIASI